MKWFKHDANANTDAKLKRVRMKYGMEGYGLYWLCLELIAGTVEEHNLTFELEYDAELIACDTGMHHEKVEEMMRYMAALGLFENDRGVVTCLKMATRTDEYTQKLIRMHSRTPDNVRRVSGETPDRVRIKSELLEENRRDINTSSCDDGAFSEFWDLYPKKVDKKKAQSAFSRLSGKKQQAAIADLKAGRFSETDRKFVPNPTTYVHGERWNDEKSATGQQQAYRGAEV